jgi:hypothetical protein
MEAVRYASRNPVETFLQSRNAAPTPQHILQRPMEGLHGPEAASRRSLNFRNIVSDISD